MPGIGATDSADLVALGRRRVSRVSSNRLVASWRWWRVTTTASTTVKEATLPYRTMPLPAVAGTMTTRRRGCGVAGGRPTEEGGGIIARMTTTRRRGGTSSPERRRLWIRTRPQSRRVRRRSGMGRGRRGWWRRRAGDRGRASTSAIVVAVSFVDIGRRRHRPSSRPSTWPVVAVSGVNIGRR